MKIVNVFLIVVIVAAIALSGCIGNSTQNSATPSGAALPAFLEEDLFGNIVMKYPQETDVWEQYSLLKGKNEDEGYRKINPGNGKIGMIYGISPDETLIVVVDKDFNNKWPGQDLNIWTDGVGPTPLKLSPVGNVYVAEVSLKGHRGISVTAPSNNDTFPGFMIELSYETITARPLYVEKVGENTFKMKLPQEADGWYLDKKGDNEDKNYRKITSGNGEPGMIIGITPEGNLTAVVDSDYRKKWGNVEVRIDQADVPTSLQLSKIEGADLYKTPEIPLDGHKEVALVAPPNRLNYPGIVLKRKN